MLIFQVVSNLWSKFRQRLDEESVSEPIDYGGDPTDIYLA